MDFGIIKKAFKTIITASSVLIGLGLASLLSGSHQKNEFSFSVDDPVGVPVWPGKENEIVVLHADELRQLRWMTVAQLNALFNGRQGKFKIESSSEAYKELRWMSPAQLEAIFGTTEIPKK